MDSTTPESKLTHDQRCQLPPEQRSDLIELIRVFYPLWRQIYSRIQRCHRKHGHKADPPCLLISGPSGAGKSTLVEAYAREHPPVLEDEMIRRPVLLVSTPSTGSITDLASNILEALGDPRPQRGTVGNKTFRAKKGLQARKVELLILDELQHFWDRENFKVWLNASNWLKDLIKQTKVACVLVGMEDYTEEVVNSNEQLARMFPDALVLEPFDWDETRAEGGDDFRKLLMQIEQALPLKEPSHLADPDRAWRCFVASNGVIGYLMLLIRTACDEALAQGREHLDDTLLATAFDLELGGKRRKISNPFIGKELPKRPPKQSPTLMPVSNINRRSRPRKLHKEGLKDVL